MNLFATADCISIRLRASYSHWNRVTYFSLLILQLLAIFSGSESLIIGSKILCTKSLFWLKSKLKSILLSSRSKSSSSHAIGGSLSRRSRSRKVSDFCVILSCALKLLFCILIVFCFLCLTTFGAFAMAAFGAEDFLSGALDVGFLATFSDWPCSNNVGMRNCDCSLSSLLCLRWMWVLRRWFWTKDRGQLVHL